MLNITPIVRNLLIANILVFLLQTNLPAFPITQLGSLYPVGSPYYHFWQFFTHMFMHASWLHLFSNMFGLISFGPLLEQRWGGQRFLAFWLLCGVGAGALYEGVRTYEQHRLVQAAQEFHQMPSGGDFANFYKTYFPDATGYETLAADLEKDPHDATTISLANKAVDAAVAETHDSQAGMLGASGALFGVLFAFAYLFPNTTLMLLFPPIPIKAKYFVFLYGAYELYSGVHRTPGDNVAHFAHLGGLLIGFIIVWYWERNRSQFY